MGLRKSLFVISTLLMSFLFSACGNDNAPPAATDYSQAAHWLSLPATVKNVDVFYLYPTAWSKVNPTDPNINEVDNASMLKGSKAAFARQASAFETVGNVYAPYYRQADALYTLTLPTLAERAGVIAGAPTVDAVAAFDYYIKHYNHGRPFILAGHSQGSNVLLNLLAGYLKANPEVYQRMVAAYVIGYSVTQSYLDENPHLKFAQNADDTGVIISYNTQSPDVAKGANPVVLDGALAINPITWTRGTAAAGKTDLLALGSFMPVAGVFTAVPQYADAKIDTDKGVVTTTADSTGLLLGFGPGIYHSYDYPFYYFNLRANAANRVAKYLSR